MTYSSPALSRIFNRDVILIDIWNYIASMPFDLVKLPECTYHPDHINQSLKERGFPILTEDEWK